METEESTPPFELNCYFGSAHIEGDTAYAYGVSDELGGDKEVVGKAFTNVFAKRDDLIHWELMDMGKCLHQRAVFGLPGDQVLPK